MLHECAEDSGVGVSKFLVRVAHEAALSGRCVLGDVRAEAALAANRAVHVEFSDVDGQAERRDFPQRLVHGFEAHRNIDVGL